MTMGLANSGTEFAGKWKCNLVFNLTTSERLEAETEVFKVEEKSLMPVLDMKMSEDGSQLSKIEIFLRLSK